MTLDYSSPGRLSVESRAPQARHSHLGAPGETTQPPRTYSYRSAASTKDEPG